MASSSNKNDGPSEYTEEQMKQILAILQEMAKTLKVVDAVLTEEKKSDEPEDNVIYIIPNIMADFRDVEGKPTKLDRLVTVYSRWSEALHLATLLNKGHLKNPVLLSHLEQGYKICKSLSYALEKNKGK